MPRLICSLRRTALAVATLTILLCVSALAGWALDVPVLRRPFAQTSPVTPLAATLLALLGLSLVHLAAVRRAEWVPRLLAALALSGALGELAVRAAADEDGLNQRLFGVDVTMARPTAAMLAVLAAGVLAAALGPVGARAARVAAIIAGALGAGALVGYAIGVEFFYGSGSGVQMAPQTAFGGVLLATGLAALVPGAIVRVLTSATLGGRFLRGTLPIVAVIQILGAVLATAGARSDLYSPAAAVWLMTMTALTCLFALVIRVALRLHADDLRFAQNASRLEQLAARDPLTGGLNRRVFDAEVQRAADHLRRYGGSGAVCVIDLDHFKDVNDNYGHAAGDDALVRVYRALRSRLRTTDVLGRIGGDEFAALLPKADEFTAASVARELADVVAEVADELAAEGRPSRLGASVGYAVMTGDEPAEAVIQRADERMYAVKRAARAA